MFHGGRVCVPAQWPVEKDKKAGQVPATDVFDDMLLPLANVLDVLSSVRGGVNFTVVLGLNILATLFIVDPKNDIPFDIVYSHQIEMLPVARISRRYSSACVVFAATTALPKDISLMVVSSTVLFEHQVTCRPLKIRACTSVLS